MGKQKTQDVERPDYRKTVLPNGVRVITEHIPTARSVSVGAWVLAGSRHEREVESGLSHFVEHMVFKGTRKRRLHHIAQRMEAVGGYLNAYTTKEYTCYYARALDAHLDRAIDVISDLVLNPVFPEKEIEREKGVVIEEIKMYEDVPEDLIFDRLEEALYRGHPLGRPIIGYPATVRTFDREGLIRFTRERYTPDRMVFAVAGNVDHDRAVRWVGQAFDDMEARASVLHAPSPNGYEPVEYVERRPIQQAHLALGIRALDAHDDRRTAFQMLNTLLGAGMSSRLNQNIREKYGYCYSIYSFVNMLSDTGEFGVYMGTDPEKVERSKKLIFRELDRFVQTPVGVQRLAQARNQLKGSLVLGLEDLSNRMMRLGRMELFFEDYYSVDDSIEAIDAVTAEAVESVAADLFDSDRFSTVVLLPSN